MEAKTWMLDELAHAGPEHLDPGFVAGFDRKQGYPDFSADVSVLAAHGAGQEAAVVDLGTGTGRFALAAAPHVRRVVAVDVSPARHLDVPGLLRQALYQVPGSALRDAGLSAGDIGECLDHDEWDVALGILTDFDDQAWQTSRYWDLLAVAAEQMRLDHQAAWCRWRRLESEHGLIRADLQLISPQDGGRRLPLPGPGILRPMWAIPRPGSDRTAGLHIAAIWVESMPEIPPGGRAFIRLAPLTPDDWKGLVPGDVIIMHERQPTAGTATITQTQWPQPSR